MAKAKPLETDVAKSIARLIPHLKTVSDCNILSARIRERSKAIFSAAQAAKNRSAFADHEARGVGSVVMREPSIASWDLDIRAGEPCVILSFHHGRKHEGFWVTPERLKDAPRARREIWVPIWRATSLIPYVAGDPNDVAAAQRTDAAFGAILGVANASLRRTE